MKQYGGFAYIYDQLINQNYEKWADYIEEAFLRYGDKPRLVLDLACGTGSVTALLAQRGYDMIGLDASPDMLSVAAAKSEGLGIQYICQDMTDFELYGTVDAVICTLDGINYITDEKKLQNLFFLVKNYLNPNGLFIFDVNSEYKLSKVLGNNSFIYDADRIFYTWENFYDKKTSICTYQLTFFLKNGAKYERTDEIHKQRAYNTETLCRLIKNAGISVLGCFDGLSFNEFTAKSQRLMFVCKNIC